MRTRTRIRCLTICVVVLASVGAAIAASDVTADQYVAEFLTQGKSQIAPDGWSPDEQLLSDEELIAKLREQSPTVLAVAILNAGIHPRWTIVFLSDEGDVRIIATLTYWGVIQSKRDGTVKRAKYDKLVQKVVSRLTCTRQLEQGFMMRGLAYWESGEVRYCEAAIFGDDDLGPGIEPLLDATEIRFSVWNDKDR